MSEVLDKTKKALRAVLISAPRGVPQSLLGNDFKKVMGYEMPYKSLGFQRLEDFVKTIPDVVFLGNGVLGEPTYFAVGNAKTTQIMRFVATQKKPTIKKARYVPPATVVAPSGFTRKAKFGPMSSKKSYRGGSAGYSASGRRYPNAAGREGSHSGGGYPSRASGKYILTRI